VSYEEGSALQLLVGDIFRQAALAVPDRMAAALGESSITFGELEALASGVAARLTAVGVGHGDRVLVWSATSLDVVPVYVACAFLGAVFCPMSPLFTAEEAAALVEVAEPRAILVDGERSMLCSELGHGRIHDFRGSEHGHPSGARRQDLLRCTHDAEGTKRRRARTTPPAASMSTLTRCGCSCSMAQTRSFCSR